MRVSGECGLHAVLGLACCGVLIAEEAEPYFDEVPLRAGVAIGVEKWLQADGFLPEQGVRSAAAGHGLGLFGSYTAEVWGNPAGGQRTGAVYTGLLAFGATLDLETAFNWPGASVNTTWLWISGQDISGQDVGNFLPASNIAAFQTLRMFELWFEQKVWDDRISLRVGQIAADADFIVSGYAETFINGTFGWPAFVFMNLPAGGPGYPMGTPGVRLAVEPTDWFMFQSAVFQGNVYEQNVNRHGFRWRLDGENGFLFLNEAQVSWEPESDRRILPGQGKAGMWIQTGELADVLAESTHSGNYGFYFILDQMLYREPTRASGVGSGTGKSAVAAGGKSAGSFRPPTDSAVSEQGLGWFARIAFAKPDRNFINFYFDTGLAYTGLIPGRDDDIAGLAFAFARLGGTARDALIDDGSRGVGGEMVLEATYQCRITRWLSVQPDAQFIINPGGSQDFENALVIGGRVTVAF